MENTEKNIENTGKNIENTEKNIENTEKNIENTETIIIYKTYHLSQAKASKKYYNQNKDELYEKLKQRLNNDPELKKKRAESVKKYREKKKLEKLLQNNTT